MEPVEIDIRMKQNVTEEGKKATGAMGEMDEAAKKMQEQVESMLEQRKKLIADIEKNLSKTATNISNTSDTLSGDVSKLKKASDILGESLEGAKKQVADVESTLATGTATLDDYTNASEQLNQAGTELGDILAKSNELQDISNELMKAAGINSRQAATAKKLWAAATEVLSSKLGISLGLSKALAATGIGAIIAAVMMLINLYNKWSKKQEEINRLKKEFADIEKGAIKGMADEKVAAEQLMRVAGDHTKNLDLRKQAVEKLNKLMPDYNGYINREGQLIGNADTALKNYLVSLYKVEKAKKLIAGIEEDTANIDNLKSTGSDPVTFLERMGLGAAKLLTPTNYDEISNKFFQNKSKKWINQISGIEAGKKQKEDELQKLLGDNNVFTSIFGSPDKPSGGPSSSTPSTKKEYDAQTALAEQLLEIRKRTAALTVDIMQDGLEKRLQQIDLEEGEELARIKEHQQKILDEYNKSDAGKNNPQADIKSIPGIDPATLAAIEAEKLKITDAADKKRVKATADANAEIVKLANSYADERTQIALSYEEDIAKLTAGGQTSAVAAAKAERDKRISDVTAEMITSTELYKTATDEKLAISAEATARLIEDIKKRIAAEVAAGNLSKEKAKEMLDELDKTGVSPDKAKNQNNPFAQLATGVGDYKKALEGVKTAKAGGANPEEVAKLEAAANAAMTSTAAAAGAALAGVQQILGSVVDGLDQLGMLTEEEKQTANEVMGMVGGAANLAMGIASGNPIQIIQGSIDLLVNGLKLFDKKSKDIEKAQKKHLQNVSDLERTYTKLQRAVDKALGTDVYGAQKALIENNKKQIAEYEAWIAQERKKKKKKQDEEAIKDKLDKIQELKNNTEDQVQAITESLAQTNAKDLAGQLADALVSAFRTGEDAAEAMGNVIDDVLRNAVVNSLKLKFLEGPLNEAVQYLADAMDSKDGLTEAKKEVFKSMVTTAGNNLNEGLKAVEEIIGKEPGSTGRRSASKGIAQASQDSIDELSGTITFMAGEFRTANVLAAARTETGRDMLIITRTILSVLNVIAENTSYNKRLEDIAEGIEKLNRDGVLMKR